MKVFWSIFFTIIYTLGWSQSQEIITVMSYNLNYYKTASAPCTPSTSFSQKDQYFKTIIDTVLPDILAVNELGAYADNSAARSIINNVLNKSGRNYYNSAAYSNNSFSEITNQLFYDTTKLVLKGQTEISSSLNNIDLVRVIDVYHLYYKASDLATTHDTIHFSVAVAHLKAGNTTNDQDQRKLATSALMNYLSNDLANKNVILCGDLNTYSSTETPYQDLTNYTSDPSEQFYDPLNYPGSWNNTALYAPIHTQSTHVSSTGCFSGGGLDDRFDFILTSAAVLNGTHKVGYVNGSYKAFGQDGNHFNNSINAGGNTAVSPTVADALYNFSDHLPVVAKFAFEKNNSSIAENTLWKTEINFANPITDDWILQKRKQALSKNILVKVYNITGQKVYEQNWDASEHQIHINTSQWNKGIYLINFSDIKTGESITKKTIKR